MSGHKTVATYFKSLRLENVRCFEDVCLDLAGENGDIAQWTLLLGDNGVGKTTLLQCLCWMRPAYVEDEVGAEETDQNIETNEDLSKAITEGSITSNLLKEENDVLEALLRISKNSELKMEGELWQGVELNSPNTATGTDLKSKEIATEVILYDENRVLSRDPYEKKVNITQVASY